MKIYLLWLLFLSMAFVSADTNKKANASGLNQFRNNAMDILDNPYCRKRFRSYLKKKKPKAFLFVTRRKEKTAFCTYVASKTLDAAEKTVINRCEKRKKKARKNKFTSPCQILARNNTLLFSRADFGLKPQTKDLFYVVERYGVDEVKKIIETGVDINQKNTRGLTPLHVAVEENDLEVIKYLLSKGADLKLRNNDGDDALIIATKGRFNEVFVYLLSQGADITTIDPRTKRQPIHTAALQGNIRLLEVILNKGVDVNQETTFKEVPLHLAIQSLFVPTVKYLIEKGANINTKDKFGKTSLDIAKKYRQKKMIAYLIKQGAKSADSL